MKARAFWALVKMPAANAQQYIAEAIKDNNADLRITGLRAAGQLNKDVIATIKQLVNDPDPQVRRECAIALHHNKSAEAADLWASLAVQHDGKDRWYLEALGIGADRQWDKFFRSVFEQSKRSVAVGGVLQQARGAEEAAAARLDNLSIRSPADGVILTATSSRATSCSPGAVLLVMARDGDPALGRPDEKNLALLRLGQPAIASADAFPASVFPARVAFIAPSVDPHRGTVEVKLDVEDRRRRSCGRR